MENSKKKSVILIIIFISLFVLGYFYRTPILDFLKTRQTTESRDEIKLQEQAGEIIKTKDFGRCDEIKDEMYQTVCINNIALNLAQETQDISYCQKIDDKLVSVSSCESQIIFQKSLDKEDIRVCQETQNTELQKQCQENFWPNLALKKEDIKICNNLQTEQDKNLCSDNYLFQKEFITQKPAGFDCEKFKDEQVRADCKIYKTDSVKQTPDFCAKLKSNLFLNHCFLNNLLIQRGLPK